MVLGECGRIPLQITYMTKAVKYWCKLISSFDNHNNSLQSQCYNMMLSHDEVGRVNWVTYIKNILFKFGFGFVWVSQDVGHADIFITIFKQRLSDTLQQKWIADLNDSSKSHYYRQFKSLLNVEMYLSRDLPLYMRTAMSRFRCGNFGLKVETGRYDNIDYNLRLCPFCLNDGLSFVEDEYHVLLVCKQYEHLRNIYLTKHIRFTSLHTFISLLSSDNCGVVYEIGRASCRERV